MCEQKRIVLRPVDAVKGLQAKDPSWSLERWDRAVAELQGTVL
jgi:hypothetical protein